MRSNEVLPHMVSKKETRSRVRTMVETAQALPRGRRARSRCNSVEGSSRDVHDEVGRAWLESGGTTSALVGFVAPF